MTPQPSMKRGRQWLNPVSTELGEGQIYLKPFIVEAYPHGRYLPLSSHILYISKLPSYTVLNSLQRK
jgi:hypothetical protein